MWPYRDEDAVSVASTVDGTGDDMDASSRAHERVAIGPGLARALRAVSRCCCEIALRCAVANEQLSEPHAPLHVWVQVSSGRRLRPSCVLLRVQVQPLRILRVPSHWASTLLATVQAERRL